MICTKFDGNKLAGFSPVWTHVKMVFPSVALFDPHFELTQNREKKQEMA
jgi:hypothetical protein